MIFPSLPPDDVLTQRFRALDAELRAKREAAFAEVDRSTDAALADLRRTAERPAVVERELDQEDEDEAHAP